MQRYGAGRKPSAGKRQLGKPLGRPHIETDHLLSSFDRHYEKVVQR